MINIIFFFKIAILYFLIFIFNNLNIGKSNKKDINIVNIV